MKHEYVALKTTTLSATAETVTVQQPASGAKDVYFVDALVHSSVAATLTIERDGTAATTTTLTPVKTNSWIPTATATAFHTSNAGSGTAVSNAIDIPANTNVTIDLSSFNLLGAGTAKNLTLKTNSITGTVKIRIKWEERSNP